MLYDIARIRQAELLHDGVRLATLVELEQVKKVERLRESLRIASARLGFSLSTSAR